MSYDFKVEAGDKTTLYRDLASALEGLVAGEPDAIANMANASALIFASLPDVNWVGFYRNVGGELVLGPFQGRAACIRIAFGTGVCGTAASTREVQLVEDVHEHGLPAPDLERNDARKRARCIRARDPHLIRRILRFSIGGNAYGTLVSGAFNRP